MLNWKIRKLALLLAAVLLLGLGAGCADRVNVDHQIFALGLGVDKGEKRSYRFSVIYPEFMGSQGDESQKLKVAMAEADSVQEATLVINASLMREVNYSHINYIVASEAVAREGSLKNVLYQNDQWIPLLGSAAMIVAKGGAQAFLEGYVDGGGISFDKQQKNVMTDPDKTALYSYCSMFTYLESCAGGAYDAAFSLGAVNERAAEAQRDEGAGGDEETLAAVDGLADAEKADGTGAMMDYLPGEMIREAGSSAEIYGSAIFDNEHMVGELSGNETQLLLMANGRFKEGYFSLRNVGGIPFLALRLSARRAPTVDISLGANPSATITVHLNAEMQGLLVRNDIIEAQIGDQSEVEIRNALTRCLSDGLSAVGQKCRSANSDAMMLGKHAIRQFATTAQWEDYRWKEKYPNLALAFDVDVVLEHYNVRVENS